MKSGNKEFRHYRFALNCSLLYSRSDSIGLKRYGVIQVLPFQHTVTATVTFCRDRKIRVWKRPSEVR